MKEVESLKYEDFLPKENKTNNISIEDETPSFVEMAYGLLLGIGYLTVFAVIPFTLLRPLLVNLYSEDAIATIAQVVTGIIVIGAMLYLSRRQLSKIIKGFTKDNFSKALRYMVFIYAFNIIWNIVIVYVFKGNTSNANQDSLNALISETPITLFLLTCMKRK